MATEKVQKNVRKTLCKDCIKQLCDVFGEDMGYDEAGEFYDTFRAQFLCEWIDELLNGKMIAVD